MQPRSLPPGHLPAVGRRPPLQGEIVSHGPRDHSLLTLLDSVSFVMDRLIQVPGTRFRVGLNSLFLLFPFVGDLLTGLVSVGIVLVGLTHYRVPRIVGLRMVLNVALDAGLGWIPLLGDLFDMFYKADTRNVRLLREYLDDSGQPPRATWRHWAFVLGVIGVLVLVFALIVIGVVVLVQQVIRVLHGA